MADIITRKENMRRIVVMVIAILVIIGGAVLGGMANSKTKELEEQQLYELLRKVKDVKEARDRSYELVDEISEPIGFRIPPNVMDAHLRAIPADVVNIQEFLAYWAERFREDHAEPFDGWEPVRPDPRLYQDNPAAAVPVANPAGPNPLHLTQLLAVSIDLQEKYAGEKEAAETTRATAMQRVTDELERIKAEQEEKNVRIDELRNDVETIKKRYYEQTETYATQIRAEERRLLDVNERIAVKKREVEAEVKVIKDEIAEYVERRTYLVFRHEEQKSRRDPDGRVIFADMNQGFVYLDFTVPDGLFRGTSFQVFGLRKGGVKYPKGVVQVVDVGEMYTKAIIRRWESGEPYEEGDYVYNDDYIRDKPRTFAFAGKFRGPLSEDELVAEIKDFGAKYATPVSLETDYLVVGENYEEDPVYDEAVKFGIKVIREMDLYQYLGILNLYHR